MQNILSIFGLLIAYVKFFFFKIHYFLTTKFTNVSLFFLFLFTFNFFILEYKLYIIKMDIQYLNYCDKLLFINKFINSCVLVEKININNNYLNLSNAYLNNTKQLDIDLLYNVLQNYAHQNKNVTHYILSDDWDSWVFLKNNNIHLIKENLHTNISDKINYNFNIYNYLNYWRKVGPIMLLLTLLNDFFLNAVFIN